MKLTHHRISLTVALLPIPLAVYDTIMLRLWQGWWGIPFAAVYTAVMCLLIYSTVRSVARWLGWAPLSAGAEADSPRA
jgi:hypothetical protein